MKKILLSVFLLLAVHFFAIAQAPYTVTVKFLNSGKLPPLQSFCHAVSQGKVLLFGGRTNGFHRTSDRESTFPSKFANDSFYVVDLSSWQVWRAAVPSVFLPALSATNMQFYQDGKILYCNGGYGSTCPQDSASCYQTFPNLTALNVPNIIASITNGKPVSTSDIITITDDRMRVTGGELEKLGNTFYLAFGHNFNTIYKGGITGIYTERIRRFQINFDGKNLSIANYDSISTPLTYQGLSQFHRRDLNIVPSVMPDQTIGLSALGGVFTTQAGPFPNPISIFQTGTVQIDTSFQQNLCLYECAKVLMYDPTAKNMYTSLLGGITNYYYQGDSLIPSNLYNFMPFFDHVSPIARDANGNYTEYPQPAPALPGFIGSNAVFIPASGVNFYGGTNDIIDYSQLQGNTLVGWMYGGILASAQQANEFNPTYASSNVYEVWIQKNTTGRGQTAKGTMRNFAQMPGANVIDSSFSAKLNYFRQHPAELYAHPNHWVWRTLGYIILIGLLIMCFYYFRTSALCRDVSYDPATGLLRPVKDRPYSFARVQLFWWTVIIFFCYAWFFAHYGVLFPPNPTVAILLGGGLAVFVFGKTIDNSQTKTENEAGMPASRHQDLNATQGFLTDILSDDSGIGIHRLQAVIFNVLFGVAFLEGFLYNVSTDQYPFIDFDSWQFVLLGISATGYLGVKANENSSASRPERAAKAQVMRAARMG